MKSWASFGGSNPPSARPTSRWCWPGDWYEVIEQALVESLGLIILGMRVQVVVGHRASRELMGHV
jgi:hypothetical protein